MKTVFFLLSVLALMGAGVYMKLGNGMEFSGGFISDNSIAPAGEWQYIMPGKWEFNAVFKAPKECSVLQGEVEYTADGDFNRFVTVKYYHDPNKTITNIDKNNVKIIAGGSVSGKWMVGDEGTWKEVAQNCDMPNSLIESGYNTKYEACLWFPLNDTVIYGNSVYSLGEYELQAFNKEKILIKGRTFNDDGNITYTFHKVSD